MDGWDFDLFEYLCRVNTECDSAVMQSVVMLAVELSREGREGQRVGAIFVVGDEKTVRSHSRPLILDPLFGHAESLRSIFDPNLRETIKELALLDGAFIISTDGVAMAACRYLSVDARGIQLPLGLGTRHLAAAGITAVSQSVAVVVSESGLVRIFSAGELTVEIVPELWLLSKELLPQHGLADQRKQAGVKIFYRPEAPPNPEDHD